MSLNLHRTMLPNCSSGLIVWLSIRALRDTSTLQVYAKNNVKLLPIYLHQQKDTMTSWTQNYVRENRHSALLFRLTNQMNT